MTPQSDFACIKDIIINPSDNLFSVFGYGCVTTDDGSLSAARGTALAPSAGGRYCYRRIRIKGPDYTDNAMRIIVILLACWLNTCDYKYAAFYLFLIIHSRAELVEVKWDPEVIIQLKASEITFFVLNLFVIRIIWFHYTKATSTVRYLPLGVKF